MNKKILGFSLLALFYFSSVQAFNPWERYLERIAAEKAETQKFLVVSGVIGLIIVMGMVIHEVYWGEQRFHEVAVQAEVEGEPEYQVVENEEVQEGDVIERVYAQQADRNVND